MAEGAGSEDAGPSSSLTQKEGYLLKNHKGKSFDTLSLKRWFVSEGFQVQYFDQPGSNRVRKGRFDLRNVSDLRPAVGNGVKRGVELTVSEGASSRSNKQIIISFDGEPEEANAWMRLWSSAVSYQYVHDALLFKRDPELVLLFNNTHYYQARRLVCVCGGGRAMAPKPANAS